MCMQPIIQYWCKKKDEERETERKRFILWLIIFIVSLKSTKERVLWEPEEYTETLTHIHTLDNQAEQQRFMKV